MGYTTTFEGQFTFDKPLAPEHHEYLIAFAKTRHMQWDEEQIAALPDPVREAAKLPPGDDGMFAIGVADHLRFNWETRSYHTALVAYNDHPSAVPGLWCQWTPNADGTALQWDRGEKFYDYTEWLEFLITQFTAPWGYILNGSVAWEGEDPDDTGTITITDNQVEAVKNEVEETDDDE